MGYCLVGGIDGEPVRLLLPEGKVDRVGGSKAVPARPRIVSATNRDIDKMVADGNVSAAARRLDVSRSTRYRRLERLGMQASVENEKSNS